MSIAVTDVNREGVVPQLCPVCGKTPRVIQTISGTCLVLCYPHAETREAQSVDEAVGLWNRGKLFGRCVERES